MCTMDKLPWNPSKLEPTTGAQPFLITNEQVRSGFRVVELSEGFQGSLTTSQPLFYGLDTLPLFVAIVIYIPFWPGRFVRQSMSQNGGEDNTTNQDFKESKEASGSM